MACCVRYCNSRLGRIENHKENISFHKFPTDTSLREAWIAAICPSKVGWIPKTYSRVCSRHFAESRFTCDNKWRRLVDKSVPTLFLDTPAPAIEYKPSRSSSLLKAKARIVMEDHDYHLINPAFRCTLLRLNVATQCGYPTKEPSIKCAQHLGRIDKLEKRIVVLETIAKRRLLKIQSLRQQTRRLKKKNGDIEARLKKQNLGMEKQKLIMVSNVENRKIFVLT